MTVDAVWMDWEGDPLGGVEEGYEQAEKYARGQATLPPGVLDSPANYAHYCRRLSMDLLGAYLAAPVKEIFPACSTTNWVIVCSSRDHRLDQKAGQIDGHVRNPSLFTATNPVALYGFTPYSYKIVHDKMSLTGKSPDAPTGSRPSSPFGTDNPTREDVDQLYMNLLLRSVSGSQENTNVEMPWMRSVPWVDRWCPDDMDPKIPIMSRERYREALRHIWLRGTIGMQIFNPSRPGYSKIVVAEARGTRRRSTTNPLAWSDFYLEGPVHEPGIPQNTGRRRALVGNAPGRRGRQTRTFKQGGGSGQVTITPWPDHPLVKVELQADGNGKTYMLKRDGDKVTVE